MKSFFIKVFSVFVAVLLLSNFLFFTQDAIAKKKKELKPVPSTVVISVEQIPDGTVAFVVPVSFKTNKVNILSAESDSTGSLVVFSQEGVGIIKTDGNLPTEVEFTVTFKGIKKGKTKLSLGQVVDKLGGTPIEGIVATTTTTRIKVK